MALWSSERRPFTTFTCKTDSISSTMNLQTFFDEKALDERTFIYSTKTGKVYTYDIERQTQTAYAEFMNASSRYEKVYFQVNVYADGKRVNFGFVDDSNDTAGILSAVRGVIEWDETPNEVLESMHSRFD